MADSTSRILRQYYTEKDFILSPDGILKILSVIVCIVVGALALATRAWCWRAPALAGSAGAVALAAAAALAASTAAAVLEAPIVAPVLWLYTDVISSTVIGVLLAAVVVLGAAFCQFSSALVYIYFTLGIVAVGTTTGGAALAYAAAMRRVDAARPPPEPRQLPPADVDV